MASSFAFVSLLSREPRALRPRKAKMFMGYQAVWRVTEKDSG
jgi:hypothetical protein